MVHQVNQESLKGVVALSHECVIIVDETGTVWDINPAAEMLFGFSRDEVVGQDANLLLRASDVPNGLFLHTLAVQPERQNGGVHFAGRRRDGAEFPLVAAVDEYQDDDGLRYALVLRDLSNAAEETNGERRHLEQLLAERGAQLLWANEKLAHWVHVDGLTGLASASYLDEHLRREWGRAEREGTPLSLLLAEVDYFASYVQGYGESVGDNCLQQIAGMLQAMYRRGGDLCARYGDARFAVVLPGTDLEQLEINADRLVDLVRGAALTHEFSPLSDRVTVTVGGVSLSPTMGGSTQELMEQTEDCLQRAKSEGGDRFLVVED